MNNQEMDAAAYIQRGREKKSKKGAIMNYKKALELEPDNYVAYYLWGSQYALCGGDGEETEWRGGKKQFLKVVELTTAVLRNNSQDTFALGCRAFANERLNFFEEAINDLSKFIEIIPDDIEAYKHRAHLKDWGGNSKSKDLLGAIEDYSKIIELNPNDNEDGCYYSLRGGAKSDLHLYKEAIEDYTAQIEISNDAVDYYNRAQLKEKTDDDDGAIRDYLKAIEFHSNQGSISIEFKFNVEINPLPNSLSDLYYINYHTGLCKLYYKIKEYDKAIEILDKLAELYPDNVERNFYFAPNNGDLLPEDILNDLKNYKANQINKT